MTQTAHTPWRWSPWHIEEAPSAVYDANDDLVCTVSSDDTARLIAAAPDLLVALERAINFIESAESEMGEQLECGDMARAAIAKAKGGAA